MYTYLKYIWLLEPRLLYGEMSHLTQCVCCVTEVITATCALEVINHTQRVDRGINQGSSMDTWWQHFKAKWIISPPETANLWQGTGPSLKRAFITLASQSSATPHHPLHGFKESVWEMSPPQVRHAQRWLFPLSVPPVTWQSRYYGGWWRSPAGQLRRVQ